MQQNKLTRAALLLAITLLMQSLRFFIPLPPMLSTFFIGSLVNMSLLFCTESIGLGPAIIISIAAPITAYLQGLLLLPVFIFPVAFGNILFVTIYKAILKLNMRILAVVLSATGKAAFLYFAFLWLVSGINISAPIASGLIMVMSWPQFVTGCLGGVLAYLLLNKLGITQHKTRR